MLQWLIGETSVELASPHPPETCVGLLRATIDRWWSMGGDRLVIGWAKSNAFALHKRLPPLFHNSFQTFAYGILTSTGNGSRINIRFRLKRAVAAIIIFYFLLVIVVGGLIFISGLVMAAHLMFGVQTLAGQESMPGVLMACGIPAAMLCFGYGLVRSGRWFARNERQFLIDFLCAELQADLAGHQQID